MTLPIPSSGESAVADAKVPQPASLSSPTTGAPNHSSGASRPASLWVTVVAALLASLIALPGVASLDGRFPVENLSVEMTNRIRNNRDDQVAWAKERSNRWVSLSLTTISCLAVFGVSIGAIFGVLQASSSESATVMAKGFLVGGLIGLFAGVIGASLEASLLMKLEATGLDLTIRALIGHAVAWSTIGLGMAVVCTLFGPHRHFLQVAGRAIAAGVGSAIVYAPAAAVFFQLQRSDLSVPEGLLNKFFFLFSAAIFLGYGARCLPTSVGCKTTQTSPDTSMQPVVQ